ncbi:hypothetical protein 13VV501A_gene0042 [Vibrio phage 13VV501A]|nr:hypothetical protein 13VV501A_gene0042 [Vibrio phage 13VV501A]
MPLDPLLPQLVYAGAYLRPERNSYQFTNPDGARRTTTPGGPMRIETDHLGGPFSVTVQYFADSPEMVRFFQMFWLRQTFEGSIPFQCALALESPDVAEDYVVRLTRAPQWNGFTGFQGRVACTYQVEQRAADYEYDDTLLWFLQEYGSDAWHVLNELYILTNPTMDKWIPDV